MVIQAGPTAKGLQVVPVMTLPPISPTPWHAAPVAGSTPCSRLDHTRPPARSRPSTTTTP